MSTHVKPRVSVIIPVKNEAIGLKTFLPALCQTYPEYEILVINDGSTDDTVSVALSYGVKVISHPYSIGNGAAIKTGAKAATGDIFIFMDGDGQHQVEDIAPLLAKFNEGYDMVVGARNRTSQATFIRWVCNSGGNYLASKIVNHPVLDLTSGMRVVAANKFKEFLHLLPNGFSTPTTITMAFFRTGYSVTYLPIQVKVRIGHSHLKPFTDSLRFLLIIYKMTTFYSPIKVFLPLALLSLIAGLGNYFYTYITQGRFTNMSAVLLSVSVIILLIGLVSEQITLLMFAQVNLKSDQSLPKSIKKKAFLKKPSVAENKMNKRM